MSLRQQRRGTIAGSTPAALTYAQQVLADSPLIYWKLDETSGTTAADASGNGRDGTIAGSGVTYSASPVLAHGSTSALTFDGSTGRVVSPSINMNAYTSFTVEFWMNIAAFDGSDDGVVALTNSGTNNSGGISIIPCWGGGFWFTQAHATGSQYRFHPRPSAAAPHHYAFVFTKNTTGAAAIVSYLDGAAWSTAGGGEDTSGTTDASWASSSFYLGSNGNSAFIPATIDEFALYGTDIGATRVAAHHTAGS